MLLALLYLFGLVAGTGFVPDCNRESVPLIMAQWVYEPAKQGARKMRRVRLAA